MIPNSWIRTVRSSADGRDRKGGMYVVLDRLPPVGTKTYQVSNTRLGYQGECFWGISVPLGMNIFRGSFIFDFGKIVKVSFYLDFDNFSKNG